MKFTRETLLVNAFVLLVGITVGATTITLARRTQPAPMEIIPPPPTATPAPTATPSPLRVHVTGAVMAPGVYELAVDSRVEQAVAAAGGFVADADTRPVNLAQPLVDGMQIYIPEQAEALPPPPVTSSRATGSAATGTAADGVVEGSPVNINTATLDELDRLPGIGPATAQKIIEFREANGPFATLEAIMEVPGIGEGKFATLQGLITLGP